MTLLHEEQTPYANYRIVQRGRRVDMDVQGAVFATFHPTQLLTGYSWDAITAAAALTPYKRVRRLLMLGVAGGTCLRQMRHLWPKAELVGLDIDRQLIRAANRFMGLEDCHVKMVFGDADKKLKSLLGPFDVIIDDLYKCGDSDVERGGVPFPKRLQNLLPLLAPKGIIAANFINDVGFEQPLAEGQKAFQATFKENACIRSIYGYNQVFVGGKSLRQGLALNAYSSQWVAPRDTQLWRDLKVEAL